MLMEARDADSGAVFSDAELRNEAFTMLLAGHETDGVGAVVDVRAAGAHPDAAARVSERGQRRCGRRVSRRSTTWRGSVTTQVIQEAMRLYPPIWAIERRAVVDDVIGGFAIPAGSSVIVSPYVLHRHPAFWR